MAKEDYAENLFQSIDTIIGERIKNLPYDHTIVATIVDAKNAYLGAYQVTTDNYTTFTAYSDVKTYNKHDRVYVRIVDTNYNRFKVITGKYIEQVNIKNITDSDIITYTIQNSNETLNINKEFAAQGYYLEIRDNPNDSSIITDYPPDSENLLSYSLEVRFFRLGVENDTFIAFPIYNYSYMYGINNGTSVFDYNKILEGQYNMASAERIVSSESDASRLIDVSFTPIHQTAQQYVSIRCYTTLPSGIIIRSNVYIIKSNIQLSKQYRHFNLIVDNDQFFVFNAKGKRINNNNISTQLTIKYLNTLDPMAKFTTGDQITITSSQANQSMFQSLNLQWNGLNNSDTVVAQITLKDQNSATLNTSFLVETLTFTITKDNVDYIITKDFYFGYQQIDSITADNYIKLFIDNDNILNYLKLNIGNLLTTEIINNALSMNLGGKSLKADGTWDGTAASAAFATTAATATTADKLTNPVGTNDTPIYIAQDGTPTALTASIGSATQPVYLTAGTITPIDQISINSTNYDIVTAINKIINALTNNVELQSNHTLWQNT